MTLKRKIISGYAAAFSLTVLVLAWAVINLVSLGRASDAILRENYRSILAAENMIDALERQDSALLLMLLGDDAVGVAQFREYEAVFLQWLVRAKDNITIPAEAEIVQVIEESYSRYRRQFFEINRLLGQGPPSLIRVKERYQETVSPTFQKVRNGAVELRNLNEEAMSAASMQAHLVARRAIGSTTGMAAVALIAALAFSLLFSERLVRPLRSLMAAARRIGQGDYSVQVQVEKHDELGHLAEEFNRMAEQLSRYHELNIEQILSEKQKSEAILAGIEDGVVVLDSDLKVTGLNPSGQRMLGAEVEPEQASYCADLLPERICELVRETGRLGVQPSLAEEERVVTILRNGTEKHYFFGVTMIRGRNREFSGIVLLLRDITRLKEVERLKSEFVMAASHELRTPLTSMGMSIDLLLEHASQNLGKRDRELLETAHEEVQRLKSLVNDLLDLSKIEAGRIELQFDRLSVPLLLEHARSVFKGQLEKKAVEFSVDIPADLPEIRADANKITWVMTNLISNALRYVPEGGQIKVYSRRAGPQVQVSVQDDGPGIPREYQTKIFQRFVQVKGRESGGTGLGLAICKEIVRAHGGTIWVESNRDRGSTFTFTVPAA